VGAGILYVGLLGAWAVVLVQYLRRRHDEIRELNSADRFSNAMRILSRRTPTPDQRYVVMPTRPQEDHPEETRPARWSSRLLRRHRLDVSADPRDVGERRPAPQPDPDFWSERQVRGRRRVVLRRRRVLLSLVAGLLVTTLAAVVSSFPWWVVLVTAIAAAGYAVHLRAQTRQMAQFDRRREAARARLRARQRRIDSAERVVATRRAREDERVASLTAAEEELLAREEEERRAAAYAAERSWQPVPVPLPTYVTKPKAVRPGRYAVDAAWLRSSGQAEEPEGPLYADFATAEAEAPYDQEVDTVTASGEAPYDRESDPGYDGDAGVPRRRAVGG
jgi:hypothetical protein